MARFKKIPSSTNEGKITYGNDIISDIVYLAVKEIPHVDFYSMTPYIKNSNSINVYVEKDGVYVDVTIKTHYLQNVSDIAFKVQEAIRHNVEAMTEYHIANVNVIVKGVTFEDEVTLTQKEMPENTEEKQ